ncbi:hypothetical protein Ga0100231_005355 [Opitutaceae bacterium TAV4]|uniref:hypothetical protein n=1 Tax=Geminisphaera colitermitum TaxID=1148786 RepID=UPI000158C982|nr:hypothetical protein [Geminisphaera colitermitum]RRJ97881.1 hypothetical protein Ga0100231_005355 [Opitutaceae bacterium TAV4]RRK02590.1 hypothetical protein Ga0100230_005605 [Opitutaceae bacterium TAV3]
MIKANITPAIAAAQLAAQAVNVLNSIPAQIGKLVDALENGTAVRPQGAPQSEPIPITGEDLAAALGADNVAALKGIAAALAAAKPVTK